MTKRLSLVANGFVRREDLDFSDDGSYFRGYEYDGMPVTYCKYQDEYFICVRYDYLENSFTYEDWKNTEEYKLADEFNGVTEVDVDKLIENCIKVKAKVNELNAQVENEVIDATPLIRSLSREIIATWQKVENFKKNYMWWNASEYELTSSRKYILRIEEEIKDAKKLIHQMKNNELSTIRLRDYDQFFKRYGYVKFSKDNFYLRELEERLENQENA